MQDPATGPSRAPHLDEVERVITAVFDADTELRDGLTRLPTDDSFDALMARLWALLADLPTWLARLRIESPEWFWVLFTVLFGLLALLVWHISYSVRTTMRAFARTTPTDADPTDADRVRDHHRLLDQARELATSGSHRDAIRCLVLSLLALLDERRVLHTAQGWTLREILGRLGDRAGDADLVARFRHDVERATFGRSDPDRATFERVLDEIEALDAATLAAARRGP